MAVMSKARAQEGHVSNPEQNASVKAPAFSRIAPAALSSVSSETSKTRIAISLISSVPPVMALILLFITVDNVTGNPEIYSPPGGNPGAHKLVSAGNIPLAGD
jgi:hypothetical protein